jgi:hypothetical protein
LKQNRLDLNMPGVKRSQYATAPARTIIKKSAGTSSAAKNNSDFFMG